MSGLIRLLVRLYTVLLHLYPPDFQMMFGAEMRSTFVEQIKEAAARGALPLVRVCMRELRDLPASSLREYWSNVRRNIQNEMSGSAHQHENAQPDQKEQRSMSSPASSWRTIALATLPGVIFLADKLVQILVPPGDRLSWYPLLAWTLILICGAIPVMGFARERRLPVWSFSALGIVLSAVLATSMSRIGSLSSIWEEWLTTILFALVVTLYYAAPVCIGIILARRTGVVAGLVLVGAAYVLWAEVVEPEYGLLLYTDNRVLVNFVAICPQLFFLILAPAVALYLSSTRARLWGYLVTIGGGLLLATTIASAIRPYPSFAWTFGVDFTFILLPLLAALGLYRWAGQKTPVLNQI